MNELPSDLWGLSLLCSQFVFLTLLTSFLFFLRLFLLLTPAARLLLLTLKRNVGGQTQKRVMGHWAKAGRKTIFSIKDYYIDAHVTRLKRALDIIYILQCFSVHLSCQGYCSLIQQHVRVFFFPLIFDYLYFWIIVGEKTFQEFGQVKNETTKLSPWENQNHFT